jgi:hypothetical protein
MHSDTDNYPSLDGIYQLTSYLGDPKWRTLLWINGIRIHLGDFDNYEDAIKVKEKYMERH